MISAADFDDVLGETAGIAKHPLSRLQAAEVSRSVSETPVCMTPPPQRPASRIPGLGGSTEEAEQAAEIARGRGKASETLLVSVAI
jgi:hypothetical protein